MALVLRELSEVINMKICDDISVIEQTEIIKQQELDFLDTLELENYLKNSEWSILKIMDEIQEDHGSKYKKESYIFNAIEPSDFIEYIHKRYKGKYEFYTYIETRVKINDKKAY